MSWNGNPLTETKESGKIARRRPPRFELIAGNVCLDFVNTLDDRNTQPKELLESYLDLARFAEDTGLLDSSQVDRGAARGDPRCFLGDHQQEASAAHGSRADQWFRAERGGAHAAGSREGWLPVEV